MKQVKEPLTVTVNIGTEQRILYAAQGSNLREVLLAHDIKSFKCLFEENDHCEGTGLCGDCGVWVRRSNSILKKTNSRPFLSCGYVILESIVVDLIANWVPSPNRRVVAVR